MPLFSKSISYSYYKSRFRGVSIGCDFLKPTIHLCAAFCARFEKKSRKYIHSRLRRNVCFLSMGTVFGVYHLTIMSVLNASVCSKGMFSRRYLKAGGHEGIRKQSPQGKREVAV